MSVVIEREDFEKSIDELVGGYIWIDGTGLKDINNWGLDSCPTCVYFMDYEMRVSIEKREIISITVCDLHGLLELNMNSYSSDWRVWDSKPSRAAIEQQKWR